MVVENCLLDKGGGRGPCPLATSCKIIFCHGCFAGNLLFRILQAIQNIFGPSTPRILTRALEKF